MLKIIFLHTFMQDMVIFFGLFSIETGDLIEGNMPRRAIRLIQDWTELHRVELLDNWFQSQKDNPEFHKIAPLE